MSLAKAARDVRENAYAPYSKFQVGAALRTPDGEVFSGCNVENVASPEGTCAEAGAIAAMVAGGARQIAEIVVVSDSIEPVTPCGGCRQNGSPCSSTCLTRPSTNASAGTEATSNPASTGTLAIHQEAVRWERAALTSKSCRDS